MHQIKEAGRVGDLSTRERREGRREEERWSAESNEVRPLFVAAMIEVKRTHVGMRACTVVGEGIGESQRNDSSSTENSHSGRSHLVEEGRRRSTRFSGVLSRAGSSFNSTVSPEHENTSLNRSTRVMSLLAAPSARKRVSCYPPSSLERGSASLLLLPSSSLPSKHAFFHLENDMLMDSQDCPLPIRNVLCADYLDVVEEGVCSEVSNPDKDGVGDSEP